MGEPVRITDLARTMIALSGMTEKTHDNPHGDVEISYVGLRPGEKLHEELFIGQSVTETIHPQIKMALERSIPLKELQPKLHQLDAALEAHDSQAVRTLLIRILELDYSEAGAESEDVAAALYPVSVSTIENPCRVRSEPVRSAQPGKSRFAPGNPACVPIVPRTNRMPAARRKS
jgi:hypothetical protein